MPFPLLAHQAPILPLRAAWPRWTSGTALVLGSLAPDLEYLANSRPAGAGLGHSLVGQLTFCLPIVLALSVLIGRADLGHTLAQRLPDRPRWTGLRNLLAASGMGLRPLTGQCLLRATASALVGSFSHLLFDAATHDWIPRRFPGVVHLRGLSFDGEALAQLASTAICAPLSLWLSWRMLTTAPILPTPTRPTTTPAEPPSPPFAPSPSKGEAAIAPSTEGRARLPGLGLLATGAFAGAFVGALRARPAFEHPARYFVAAPLYVWGYGLFFVACWAALGLLVVALGLRLRDGKSALVQEVPPDERTTRASLPDD